MNALDRWRTALTSPAPCSTWRSGILGSAACCVLHRQLARDRDRSAGGGVVVLAVVLVRVLL
jgi:hypothetical protein